MFCKYREITIGADLQGCVWVWVCSGGDRGWGVEWEGLSERRWMKQNTKDHTITEKHIYINTSIVFSYFFFLTIFVCFVFYKVCSFVYSRRWSTRARVKAAFHLWKVSTFKMLEITVFFILFPFDESPSPTSVRLVQSAVK